LSRATALLLRLPRLLRGELHRLRDFRRLRLAGEELIADGLVSRHVHGLPVHPRLVDPSARAGELVQHAVGDHRRLRIDLDLHGNLDHGVLLGLVGESPGVRLVHERLPASAADLVLPLPRDGGARTPPAAHPPPAVAGGALAAADAEVVPTAAVPGHGALVTTGGT